MEQEKKKSKIWGNLVALCFGIIVSLVLVEIILQVFHPFPFRVQHGKIILPANQKIIRKNDVSSKLEPVIYYSRNSLGLRGEEMPADATNYVKIIAIGGSTTECSYNSDSATWTEVLKRQLRQKLQPKIWVNNAGLDGTTTYGHRILLQDHIVKLRPDYVLFLVGINDTEKDDGHPFDLYHSDSINKKNFTEFFRSLLKKTETGALIENLYRYRIAYKKGLIHRQVDYAKQGTVYLPFDSMMKHITAQAPYLSAYRQRILTLDSVCKANNIRAIFITQPSLFGNFVDPATGLNFTRIKITDGRNSVLEKNILELYNDELRNLEKEGKINTIDMAKAMPKNSAYYYDFTHYTSSGTDTFGRMLSDSLLSYLH
jgi:lysophospholipase L1-like esterase